MCVLQRGPVLAVVPGLSSRTFCSLSLKWNLTAQPQRFPSTPGWGPLAVVVVAPHHSWLWVLGAVPRHSWFRFLVAVVVASRHSWLWALGTVPRHSWLGSAGCGGGRPPPPPRFGTVGRGHSVGEPQKWRQLPQTAIQPGPQPVEMPMGNPDAGAKGIVRPPRHGGPFSDGRGQ